MTSGVAALTEASMLDLKGEKKLSLPVSASRSKIHLAGKTRHKIYFLEFEKVRKTRMRHFWLVTPTKSSHAPMREQPAQPFVHPPR